MTYDVIIIGSGINSLVAAALLAKKGKKVCVYEKNQKFGGNIATEEITLPSFKHDVYSAWHPLFVTSPAYRELKDDLAAEGLIYLNTDVRCGVITEDGKSAVLVKGRNQNAANFNHIHIEDGDRYAEAMKEFASNAPFVYNLLNSNPHSWKSAALGIKELFHLGGSENFINFAGKALGNARKWLSNTFESELLQTLIAPWLLHAGIGPDDATGSLIAPLMAATIEEAGLPIPQGGAYQLAEALVNIAKKHGAEFCPGVMVQHLLVTKGKVLGIRAKASDYLAEYVLANVSPTYLYQQLLRNENLPKTTIKQAAAYQYGRAGMQLHFALSEPLDWDNPELKGAGIIHLCDSVAALSLAVNQASNGYLPELATVVVGQPTAIDPSRAPEGKHILWVQLQEMPNIKTFKGDAAGLIDTSNGYTAEVCAAYAERIIERIQKHAPNFKSAILKHTIVTPMDLESYNPNLVGGDPYCGAASIDQFLYGRPFADSYNHDTPVKNLYHIGAATHPGPGLDGMSGYLVAKEIG